MPRPLVALAVVFAIVIGAAAVLLYRADRQRVQEVASAQRPRRLREAATETEPAAGRSCGDRGCSD